MDEIAPLTFEANDKLGLKPFSEKLGKFLIVEHDFVEGSLVVSLNAPFGAGKTTFLSMWKSDLGRLILGLVRVKTLMSGDRLYLDFSPVMTHPPKAEIQALTDYCKKLLQEDGHYSNL